MTARTQKPKSVDSEAPLSWVFAQYRARRNVAGMKRIPFVNNESIECGLDSMKSFEEMRVINYIGLYRRIGLQLIDHLAAISFHIVRRDLGQAGCPMAIERGAALVRRA